MDGNGDQDYQLEDEEQVSGHIRNLVYICPVDHVGTSVFVKGWLVQDSQKAPIVLVHDLGETAVNMGPLALQLAEAGHSVYSFDQRGHGQSGRRLGHIPGFQQLSLDLLQVVAWVKHKEAGKKPIIVGQGLGALVALVFAKGHRKFCAAIVLASPMMDLSDPIRPSQRLTIQALAEVFPTFMIPYWLCPQFTSEPPSEKRRGAGHPKISAFLANELLLAVGQARKLFDRLSLPTLIMTPSNDKLYKYELLKKRVAKHKRADLLVLKSIESSFHRLFSSQPQLTVDVAAEILAWMAGLSEEPDMLDEANASAAAESDGDDREGETDEAFISEASSPV